MAQTITRGFRQLVDEALAKVKTLEPLDALRLFGRPDTVFVDLRDPREREREGIIPGAFHCPRGMLEFWVDPVSPYHKPIFAEDKSFIFFCAGGWRSALGAKTAQEMGLHPVSHIYGGFSAWREAGGPTAPLTSRG